MKNVVAFLVAASLILIATAAAGWLVSVLSNAFLQDLGVPYLTWQSGLVIKLIIGLLQYSGSSK